MPMYGYMVRWAARCLRKAVFECTDTHIISPFCVSGPGGEGVMPTWRDGALAEASAAGHVHLMGWLLQHGADAGSGGFVGVVLFFWPCCCSIRLCSAVTDRV